MTIFLLGFYLLFPALLFGGQAQNKTYGKGKTLSAQWTVPAVGYTEITAALDITNQKDPAQCLTYAVESSIDKINWQTESVGRRCGGPAVFKDGAANPNYTVTIRRSPNFNGVTLRGYVDLEQGTLQSKDIEITAK